MNDDIEILDFDEEEIYTKNEVHIDKKVMDKRRKNNNTKVQASQITELKEVTLKKKKNKKLYKGEKIFLTMSILFILGCFVFYGYRTYYYYHLTHDTPKSITLKEKLTSLNNVVYQNDGLYEKNGYYYYKGKNVSNYIYYSGQLFRIIDINNGIHMISDEVLTDLIWGIDSTYEESNIYKWLTNYLNTLKNHDIYLQESTWCNEKINIEKYECHNNLTSYIGLLNINDYIRAGGKNSFLNNENYFWTLNQDNDGNTLYINSEGNINNIYKKEDNYFSYGIRPVITLKEDTAIISGDGSKNHPYIIEELGNALLKDNSIGSFVKYNDDSYRILDIDNEGISLIYEGVLEIEKKYDDVLKYLNNDFIKKFNQDELVYNNYDITEYSFNNQYELGKSSSKKNYITIPKIGDLFLNKYDNYWLNNYSEKKLGLYYIVDDNKMLFADLKDNIHRIRPIIKLNIETVVSSGLGLPDEPLIIGIEGEENVEEN